MSLFAERLPRPRHRALCSAEQGGAWRARILDENPGSWTSRPSGLSFLVCQMGTSWDCGGRKGDLTVTVLALCWALGKRPVNTTCVITAVLAALPGGRWGGAPGVPTQLQQTPEPVKVRRKQYLGARAAPRPASRPAAPHAHPSVVAPPLLLCTHLGPALLTPVLTIPLRRGSGRPRSRKTRRAGQCSGESRLRPRVLGSTEEDAQLL